MIAKKAFAREVRRSFYAPQKWYGVLYEIRTILNAL